jgi:murein peptide amidase A
LRIEDGRATREDYAMGRTGVFRTRAMAGVIAVAAACLAVSVAAPTAHGRPAAQCLVPGTGRTVDQLWRPDVAAAVAYAHTRVGDIAFAVRTPSRFYSYRPDHQEWSASVVKAMLLVTYLDSAPVRNRALNSRDTSVLGPMIRVSDNDDAQIIFDTVGQAGLSTLARRVGMTGFATNAVWGETHITARDQTRFFLHVDDYVVARHRSYAMRLLRSIAPADRWGIGELPQPGWKLYFKGGWGYGTGLLDHQVALLVRGCARVSIAVLTMFDGSHPYGKATLKGMFARLLRGFPTAARPHAAALVPPSASRSAPESASRTRRVVIGHSVRGRPIVARVLGPDAAPRKLLLVGCIHGNECAGIAILSALARRRVPTGVQLWLVPEMNPDGTAADTRQNAHGVDLNRNFPFQWERVTDPTYDSGPQPASEPETRTAMALIRRIKPAVTIWYHQHMDLVDMAGGDRGVARRYAQLSGLAATCLGFFPGSAPSWSNHLLPGTTALVVELPAGPVGAAALGRHLRAIRGMEAGQRSGSRTSCRG